MLTTVLTSEDRHLTSGNVFALLLPASSGRGAPVDEPHQGLMLLGKYEPVSRLPEMYLYLYRVADEEKSFPSFTTEKLPTSFHRLPESSDDARSLISN